MIVRDVTETIYEYDSEGNVVKKTVTETHEEDDTDYQYVPIPAYESNHCSGGCCSHN